MFTRFTVDNAEHLMNLSGPMVPIGPETPGSDFMAFIGAAYQERTVVSRAALLESARLLRASVAENRHLLGFRYSYSIPKRDRKGSGGCSGFKINGSFHSIRGGNGECYLERIEIEDDDRGRVAERIDLRERNVVQTDDWGEIRISRRKIEFSLPEALAECIAFLESIPDAQITLFSFDAPPTLRDLVREFEEGSGGDDWAIEEICEKGSRWKGELLDALKDKRFAKHRATLVQLLLICFPDAETRNAVMVWVHGLPEKTRSELLVLVATYQAE